MILPNHQQHPADGDGVSPWNVRKPPHIDAAVCPRTFNWICYTMYESEVFIDVPGSACNNKEDLLSISCTLSKFHL